MSFSDDLKNDIENMIGYGVKCRFKYFNQTTGSVYDDDIVLTQSGTDLWVSGLPQPVTSKFGSEDSLLLKQGKIKMSDKKLYVMGNVQTDSVSPIKIGLGSPAIEEFKIVGDKGATQWDVEGAAIYKKVYIRYLTNGSFVGE